MTRVIRWVLWTPARAAGAALVLVVVLAVVVVQAQRVNAQARYADALEQYQEDLAEYEAAVEQQSIDAARDAGDSGAERARNRAARSPVTGASVAAGPLVEGETGTDDVFTGSTGGVAVAEEFFRVFYAAPEYSSAEEWVADLEPLVAPGLVRYLRITSPESVPAAPTSDPQSETGPFSATVEWEGVGEVFRVVTADTGDGWVVVDYDLTPV